MKRTIIVAAAICVALSASVLANPPGGTMNTAKVKKKKRQQTTTMQSSSGEDHHHSGQQLQPGLHVRPSGKVVHIYTVNPARERWIVNRLGVLKGRIEHCEGVALAADLAKIPIGSSMDDIRVTAQHHMMAKQCAVDKFEYDALKRELRRRINQRGG